MTYSKREREFTFALKSWSPWSQSGGRKGRRTMEERICGWGVLSLKWKRGVMDGDNGDEGADELTCVRSDESDKSSWSAGRRSFRDRVMRDGAVVDLQRGRERWASEGYDIWRPIPSYLTASLCPSGTRF